MVVNFYAGGVLDRISEQRRNPDWLAARLTTAGTCLVPVWRTLNLVAGEPDAPRAVRLDAQEAWWRDMGADEVVLLGESEGAAHFAIDLSRIEDPERHPRLREVGRFVDLRTVGPLIAREEGSLLAYARGLMWWHARHRFCGVCGSPTESSEGGHVRRCLDAACGAQHFPRTDPAVIMLVHDGDRCLLGRQSRFPPGMYSTLAGFVEPGESLEEAVAREVYEETRVRVGCVRYHSSQPWPFPASIMLGFHAAALTTAIEIRPDELDDARWFSRDWLLRTRDSDRFRLPRRDSIARRLIEDWLRTDASRPPRQ
jgi:NAD+ diphosphatase